MKYIKRGTKAQLELSFGMIVSIILIIIFISFSFYAIKKFLSLGDSTVIAKFKENLQNDVNRLWQGSQGVWSPASGYALPKAIEYVCFVDFSKDAKGNKKDFYIKLKQVYFGGSENLVFYPVGSGEGLDALTITHLDIEKITSVNNPYCIENKNGKVKLTIKKEFGENLITITG